MLTGLRQKIARWLSPDLSAELQLNRITELQSKLDALNASVDKQGGLAEALAALRSEVSSLQTGLAEVQPARATEAHKAMVAQSATFSDTAILSHEGLIENTHGDKSTITAGDHSYIRGRLLTYGHGGRIAIGDWVYVGVRTEIWSMESISIGNRVLISHDVNIHDGSAHSIDAAERHLHFRDIILRGHPKTKEGVPGVKSAPVVIEDDAWISFGVTILSGVTIGAGSVIAAGSIVTKDVPPGVLYQCEIKPIIKPLPTGTREKMAAEMAVSLQASSQD